MFFKKKVKKTVQPFYTKVRIQKEADVEPVKKETKRVKKENRAAVSDENKNDENFSEQ